MAGLRQVANFFVNRGVVHPHDLPILALAAIFQHRFSTFYQAFAVFVFRGNINRLAFLNVTFPCCRRCREKRGHGQSQGRKRDSCH